MEGGGGLERQHSPKPGQGFTKQWPSRMGMQLWPEGQLPRPLALRWHDGGPHHIWREGHDEAKCVKIKPHLTLNSTNMNRNNGDKYNNLGDPDWSFSWSKFLLFRNSLCPKQTIVNDINIFVHNDEVCCPGKTCDLYSDQTCGTHNSLSTKMKKLLMPLMQQQYCLLLKNLNMCL